MIGSRQVLVMGVLATWFGAGCGSAQSPSSEALGEEARPAPAEPAAPAVEPSASASARLRALGESGVSGTITFRAVRGGVQVEGEIRGLPPDSTHGFHIHEVGDCSAPDGTSAGGHFNPGQNPHGAPDAEASHMGDLGNVTANAEGVAAVSVFKAGASLTEGPTNVSGRGLILHADPDDLTTQPTGAAGARIACAVIEAG